MINIFQPSTRSKKMNTTPLLFLCAFWHPSSVWNRTRSDAKLFDKSPSGGVGYFIFYDVNYDG